MLNPECVGDVMEAFRGKLIAFTPAMHKDVWILGVAEANEPGYTPISTYHFNSKDYNGAAAEADRLNKVYLRQNLEASMDIVASSMAHGRMN